MNITKALIFNHFERKTTSLQRKMIDEWLQDFTNEELYYFWLEEWENNNLQYSAETDREFRRYKVAIEANGEGELVFQLKNQEPAELAQGSFRGAKKWVYGAALLLLGAGLWIFRDNITYKDYRTDFGEVKTFTLADGSKVKLNTNSSLRVPRWGFGSDRRQVLLNGEANFEVNHLPDHQKFVVKTAKQFEVVVLGTEFTMYSRKHNSRVILNKGKVQVLYKTDKTSREIFMKPGDLVSLDSHNELKLRTTRQVKEYSAWEEKRFVFEETSMEEVAYLLQENYGFQVEIHSKELSEKVLMGSFRAENADELLKSISELLDINVVRQGNKVQLSDR